MSAFKPAIILASGSPRRSQILTSCRIPFEVVVSHCEEFHDDHGDPVQIAQINAELKANHVAKAHPDQLIIAADTVVYAGNRVLGKPESLQEAQEMFALYVGQVTHVYSGVAVSVQGKTISEVADSEIRVSKQVLEMNPEIVKTLHSLESSGGFTIEGIGSMIFDEIVGSYNNILGLPMTLLYKLCQEQGIDLLSYVQ